MHTVAYLDETSDVFSFVVVLLVHNLLHHLSKKYGAISDRLWIVLRALASLVRDLDLSFGRGH